MKQAGLFGLSDHFKRLSANGDPLEELVRIVDFGAPTPDANTIRLFREKLTDAGTLQVLFDAFDHRLRSNGYMAMGGQIVDATLIASPKQRNTQDEKDTIKAGKAAQEVWPDEPAKARMAANGKPQIDIAIPSFGYKNHVAIDQRFGFIRKGVVTHGARHDRSQLREVVTTNNTSSDVWADTAYRSKTNEAWLAANGRVSRIHCKKPKGKPRSEALRAANRAKSKIRARVEHVFAQQKAHMGLFVRTIGIKRAETKIMLANLAYNMQRLIFHERWLATE